MDGASDKKRYKSIPVMRATLIGDIAELKRLISEDGELTNFVYKKSGDTPLMLAARYKHVEILDHLIECGADFEHKNIDGKRALHEAASSGCLKNVESLVESGAAVDVLKRADWTPLMFACCHGHIDIANYLLEHGADLGRINKDGWTSFHLACREGFVPVLKLLMAFQESCWNTRSKNGRTPLHTACMNGKIDVVQFLLKICSIDIRMQDSCGSTPFMDSIRFNHTEISRTLLSKDMECISDKDSLQRNCLHIAAHSGHLCAMKFLVEELSMDINEPCLGSLQTCLHLAAKEGHIDVLQYIISHSDTLNCKDKFGRTSLHLAVAANKVKAADILLRQCADYEALDLESKTPFAYALSDEMKALNKI